MWDLTIVCHAIGFDPFMGFFHQPRFGRPALALDLMEAACRVGQPAAPGGSGDLPWPST